MKAAKKAFTLVELLVVIAIVGVMVALLLPSLQNARRVARRILCANNLHQFGVALHTYAADSNGWFPTHEANDDNPTYPDSWSNPDPTKGLKAFYNSPLVFAYLNQWGGDFPDSCIVWGPYADNFTAIYGGGPRVYETLIYPGYINDWHVTVCPDRPMHFLWGDNLPDQWWNDTPGYGIGNKWMTYLGCISGPVDDPHRAWAWNTGWAYGGLPPKNCLLVDIQQWPGEGFNHARPGGDPTHMGPGSAYDGCNFLRVDGAAAWLSSDHDVIDAQNYRKGPF